MIYLDNNATTRPLLEVIAGVSRVLEDQWQNPSSSHRGGQAARNEVELARSAIAQMLGCTPRELIFTSGATESIDAAYRGTLLANPGKSTIITTPVEHESVRDLCKALADQPASPIATRFIPLLAGGIADLRALDALLDDSVALVSVQWANNETGAIHPIAEIGAACRARGILFHTDATQWAGKMPFNVASMPIDLLSFSGHKFHGIKGAGGLYIRRGVRLRPVLRGSQELERRGGTENVPGIVAMGAAARSAQAWMADPAERDRLASLRDGFEARVLAAIPDAKINSPRESRLWNTTNIAFPKLQAEALLLLLSERGVYASAGAACGSGSLDPSPILTAMGIPPELAHGSLRFSISRFTTEAELTEAASIVAECVRRLRQSSASVPTR